MEEYRIEFNNDNLDDYFYEVIFNNNFIDYLLNTNIYNIMTTYDYHKDDNFIPIIDENYFEKCYTTLKNNKYKRLNKLIMDYEKKENIIFKKKYKKRKI
jgi:hypothetical protein